MHLSHNGKRRNTDAVLIRKLIDSSTSGTLKAWFRTERQGNVLFLKANSKERIMHNTGSNKRESNFKVFDSGKTHRITVVLIYN